MSRELLDRWCERAILGLVLAILVYGPLATGAVRTADYLIVQGLGIGALGLWGLRLWLMPKPQILWPPVCWGVLAFTAYAVARYFTSDLEYAARQECVQVVLYAGLFLAIVNNLHKQEHTRIIVLVLVFLAMLIAGYAIYQFATGSDKVWTFITPYKKRGTGTYISPNNLAGFLEMVLPLGIATVLVSRAKPVLKVFVGYASLVILGGIAVSLSRGSWIAVSVSLIALFGVLLFHRSHRLPAAVLLICLVGAGAVLAPKMRFLKMRVDQTTANERLNDSARFDLWEPAVRLWRENPVWGIGPNHYNFRFRAYRPQFLQQQPDRVHNDYLNTLTDYGVAGLALVIGTLAILGFGVWKTWPCVRGSSADLGGGNSNKFAIVLGASLGVLAILVHSVVDFNMHIPANAIVAVTLLAMLASAFRFATSDFWFSLGIGRRLLLTAGIVATVTALGWHQGRTTREYALLRSAALTAEASAERAAALSKAFSFEPKNFTTAYNLGECYRLQSWEGTDDHEELAAKAMEWFKVSMRLNPYDGYGFLRYGMCLDWVRRSAESRPYYDKATRLDPNGYFTAANVGWHYVQTHDYAAARVWFERSKRLEWNGNSIADAYLPIVNELLIKQASEKNAL